MGMDSRIEMRDESGKWMLAVCGQENTARE